MLAARRASTGFPAATTSPRTRTKQVGSAPPPASVFDATPAWSARAAAANAQPFVSTTAPFADRHDGLAARRSCTRLPRAGATGSSSAFQLPSVGAGRSALKRDELSETETASNGPMTAMPTARPRKPSRAADLVDDVAAHVDVVRRRARRSRRARARSARPSPTRATVLPTTAADVARVSRMPSARRGLPSARGDVEDLVVVDGDALGCALALDHDPGADVGDDVLLDHERADGRAQRDARARSGRGRGCR